MEQELEQNSDYTVATGKRKVDNRGSIRGRADARSSSLALPRPEQQSAKTAHDAMWTPGQFILLTVANIFLSRDFEYCLRICSTDFSCVANSPLFEGTILRFRALASEELFSLVRPEEQKDSGAPDYSSLFDAIDSAKNALQIYSDQDRSLHGVALQLFQLGYIYEKHADILSSEAARQSNPDRSELFEDKLTCNEKADEWFREAHRYFSTIKHLQGQHLALLHRSNLAADAEAKERLSMEAMSIRRISQGKPSKFAYVPRE